MCFCFLIKHNFRFCSAETRKTFYHNGRAMTCVPDLSYTLHVKPLAGVSDRPDTILTVNEVR